ncbi:hypothetical protein BD410DRAFT_839822 [Rickenella mellea]|uniref:Ferritin-like domain-containing protein n=1 Tax=Rickenella mellea TaxID=50990 RepID=A0A4Y7Q509_9AGAM|nr:hypothetical protein BD410DRAFT_839822 [Rickenella mellea]
MHYLLVALAVAFSQVHGLPVKRDLAPTDVQILQFALTLEHAENAFYTEALSKFDEQSFRDAGFADFTRGRFVEISQHEATHVQFLTAKLGSDAPAACTYNFPYSDVQSFVALSQVLEGVGTSAYLGSTHFLQNEDNLAGATSILTIESRQQAWIAGAISQTNPWSGSFDTPLGFNQVFTLASPFIVSCPPSNPTLPFSPFPNLNISDNAQPGQSVQLTYNGDASNGGQFLAIFSGLNTTFVPINSDKTATLPSRLQGTTYALVSSDGSTVTDGSTVAGPAILVFPFDSSTDNS